MLPRAPRSPPHWLLLSCLGALLLAVALPPIAQEVNATGALAAQDDDDGFDGFDEDDDEEESLTRLLGMVKKSEEGVWQLRVKEGGKGTWKVTPAKDANIYRYATTPFDQFSTGTTLYVLAKYVESSPGSGGGQYPPQLTKVQAMVVGTGYEPPPVPPHLKKLDVKWHDGKLTKQEKPVENRLGKAVIQYGRQGDVVRRKTAAVADVAKKQWVVVRGKITGEKKDKTIQVSEVHIVDPKMLKSKSYRIVLPL